MTCHPASQITAEGFSGKFGLLSGATGCVIYGLGGNQVLSCIRISDCSCGCNVREYRFWDAKTYIFLALGLGLSIHGSSQGVKGDQAQVTRTKFHSDL